MAIYPSTCPIIQDEGIDVAANSIINFTGSGVSVADVSGVTTITVSGGFPSTDITTAYGGIRFQTQTKTANYTIDSGATKDNVIFCDTSGGAFTITLPTPSSGRIITLKDSKGTWASNNLSVDAGANKIDGVTGLSAFGINYRAISLISDGTDWFLI